MFAASDYSSFYVFLGSRLAGSLANQARALFREENLPQEDAASLPLPALLARVRAVASERRLREESLAGELSAALGALEEARGEEGHRRDTSERFRLEAEAATIRWAVLLFFGVQVTFVCSIVVVCCT